MYICFFPFQNGFLHVSGRSCGKLKNVENFTVCVCVCRGDSLERRGDGYARSHREQGAQ